jgi:hypothetical protein
MLSPSEIDQFIKSAPENDQSSLKDYYNKCYDNLKELNARSNKISVFLLLLLSFYAFSSYIKDAEFLGAKVTDLQLIGRLTPACCYCKDKCPACPGVPPGHTKIQASRLNKTACCYFKY